MGATQILSRHRLPQPYRGVMVGLWLLPVAILYGALVVAHGAAAAMAHPGLLFPLALMALPALYLWHEGIDVTEHGLWVRMRGWCYYPYSHLDTYTIDTRRERHVLKIWDVHNRRVLSCHATHLTELPLLLRALKGRLRWRGWFI